MFNITIDDSVTPVKMKLDAGPGGHHDELWLKDIDDPEKFMENCYDGSYAVIEDKSDLQEFGGGFPYEYNYDDRLLFEDSYIAYTRAYDDGSKPSRYDYIIAFYKDGDSFKAKVVDEWQVTRYKEGNNMDNKTIISRWAEAENEIYKKK